MSRFDLRGPGMVKRLLASLGIAAGIVLVIVGLASSITGDEAQNLPDEVEEITPVRNATQVQSQERILVDLIEGYTGVLVVNGVELPTVALDELPQPPPGEQISLPAATIFEQGNDTLSFTPTKDAAIEKFATGVNTVTLIYWKVIEGRDFARPSFTWQFDVV